jgi:antirestriction protein ArdC
MRSSDLFQSVTDRIIAGLQNGVVPWQNPIRKGYPMMPTNLVSGKPYSGANALLLSMNDYAVPYYATFNQITSLGGKVKPGQKSTEIIFWDIRVSNKETRECITNAQYIELPKEQKALFEVRPYGRFYHVFNVEQAEGLEIPKPARALSMNKKMALCEEVVTGYPNKPDIQFKPGVACYIPSLDEVRMPELNAFKDSENFYATLFHELGHSTGHYNRLNRPGVSGPIEFGSQEYSQEELVAEIAASFLCAHCQIENKVIDNSVAYLNSWISKLSNDKYMIIKAASEAQKAFNLIVKGGSK